MASWIHDGSSGFTINGNIVSYVDNEGCDNVFNSIWQDGEGVSSGKHYWKIHFQSLEGGAGVGLTSKDRFKQGYACKAIKYLGNLSNGGALLVGNFGPSPTTGDVIGILAVFEGDRLKVFIDVNGKSLGLAFNVAASTFKSIYPLVSFHKSGSATCTKQTDIPNFTDRAPTTFVGIEGDWKLSNFQENGVTLPLQSSPTCKIRKQDANQYSWSAKVCNNLGTTLSRADGKWKTSGTCATMMMGPPELMKLEHLVSNLMDGVKIVEVANESLSIKSETISSAWTRYDSSPGPYIGEPFA